MLHYVSFKNFCSFKAGATISLAFDGNTPESVSRWTPYTTVLAIKGANGSGKTNALKVIPFLSNFCANSFAKDPEDPIAFSPFYGDKELTEFEIEFDINSTSYRYQLECTDSHVVAETLFRKKSKREVKLFERKENSISSATKEFSLLQKIKLRSNASAISIAHQHEIDGIADVHAFFKRIISNVGFSGMRESRGSVRNVCAFLHKHPNLLPKVIEFISKCDIGITDIEIHENKDENGKINYFPIFIHEHEQGPIPITEYEESSGTKLLFKTLPEFLLTLAAGAMLIVDELDNHLHPHIIPKLVELFLNENTNPAGAQLIFSTHDSDVLDLLGKYRICLINKEDNESYLYRLDELPGELVRNDRPIAPLYKAGKIGGTPKL